MRTRHFFVIPVGEHYFLMVRTVFIAYTKPVTPLTTFSLKKIELNQLRIKGLLNLSVIIEI